MPGFRDLYNVTVDIESYLNDTFGKEDIFQQEMLERLNDPKNWIFKEIYTTLMGRCSVTCCQKEVKATEFSITYLINGAKNYQVKSCIS
jgi:hypothetical protein